MISLDYNLITIFHVPFIIHYFSYFSTLNYIACTSIYNKTYFYPIKQFLLIDVHPRLKLIDQLNLLGFLF